MKLSKYTVDIKIDEEYGMLYSAFSRQYYLYALNDRKKIEEFLNNINKGSYTLDEIEVFKCLLDKKIIIPDETDELKELEYLENTARYQDSVYKMIIYATNACNFRCSYCEQPHTVKQLNATAEKGIISLIEKQSKKVTRLECDWFGGEPLLEYDKVCRVLEKGNQICQKNGCELVASITTNGYLLNLERIEVLRKLNVNWMQITLDGNRETHDMRRVHINKSGTFDRILENVVLALQGGMNITLRINVDEGNIDNISDVLDGIPQELRSRVWINICNIFQNKEKLSVFHLLKDAIQKGYVYANRRNKYIGCHACLKNAVIIDTDGAILLCSNTAQNEKRMGYLSEGGNVCIERNADYYKLHTLSARDNPRCKDCVQLPFCIGSCKYKRLQNNSECIGINGSGLSLREQALLDFYSDLQNKCLVGKESAV